MPSGAVVKPDLRDAERLQGFPPGWTEAAERVGRSSWRWSLVGNAVSVPVAQWVGRRLADPGRYDPDRDAGDMPARFPKAARFDGARRRAVAISSFPVHAPRPPLHAFLNHPGDPLSARATAGFLGRARTSSLRFVDGFLDRLDDHLARMRGERHPLAAE
jgi:DNA (cytosine-5)-methyltransferase 1